MKKASLQTAIEQDSLARQTLEIYQEWLNHFWEGENRVSGNEVAIDWDEFFKYDQTKILAHVWGIVQEVVLTVGTGDEGGNQDIIGFSDYWEDSISSVVQFYEGEPFIVWTREKGFILP